MSRGYYETLELPVSASGEEICAAFQRLSLRIHPSKASPADRTKAQLLFAELAEAFEVLSNPRLRAQFDEGGHAGLRRYGYEFLGDPERIFRDFFGTDKYHEAALRFEADYMANIDPEKAKFRDPPSDVAVEVSITLLEALKGCSRTVEFDRTVCKADGVTKQALRARKEINLPPGTDSGSLVFEREGHQEFGFPNSKLIVKISVAPLDNFHRDGQDLFLLHKISLKDALLGKPFETVSLSEKRRRFDRRRSC